MTMTERIKLTNGGNNSALMNILGKSPPDSKPLSRYDGKIPIHRSRSELGSIPRSQQPPRRQQLLNEKKDRGYTGISRSKTPDYHSLYSRSKSRYVSTEKNRSSERTYDRLCGPQLVDRRQFSNKSEEFVEKARAVAFPSRHRHFSSNVKSVKKAQATHTLPPVKDDKAIVRREYMKSGKSANGHSATNSTRSRGFESNNGGGMSSPKSSSTNGYSNMSKDGPIASNGTSSYTSTQKMSHPSKSRFESRLDSRSISVVDRGGSETNNSLPSRSQKPSSRKADSKPKPYLTSHASGPTASKRNRWKIYCDSYDQDSTSSCSTAEHPDALFDKLGDSLTTRCTLDGSPSLISLTHYSPYEPQSPMKKKRNGFFVF